MKADSSKDKAVDLAVSQIERQYGKGAIKRFESLLREDEAFHTTRL
mgnify:CR=1 FL=1